MQVKLFEEGVNSRLFFHLEMKPKALSIDGWACPERKGINERWWEMGTKRNVPRTLSSFGVTPSVMSVMGGGPNSRCPYVHLFRESLQILQCD